MRAHYTETFGIGTMRSDGKLKSMCSLPGVVLLVIVLIQAKAAPIITARDTDVVQHQLAMRLTLYYRFMCG